MIDFKGFSDLPENHKQKVIYLLFVTPFWYFSLYLFHYEFYKNSDVTIPIIAAFCLSICWLIVNLFLNVCFKSPSLSMTTNVSVVSIAIFMVIAKYFSLGYYNFLFMSFGAIIATVVIITVFKK